jgi:hypothetical protein
MDMMPMDHSDGDESQDMDMIKKVLQKIIDEMDGMEADRLSPASAKPKAAEAPAEASPMDQMPEDESDDSSPMLPDLMSKADSADSEGMLPEDKESDVPPELAAIIAEKKKQLPA